MESAVVRARLLQGASRSSSAPALTLVRKRRKRRGTVGIARVHVALAAEVDTRDGMHPAGTQKMKERKKKKKKPVQKTGRSRWSSGAHGVGLCGRCGTEQRSRPMS
jgi:hypothetical protein